MDSRIGIGVRRPDRGPGRTDAREALDALARSYDGRPETAIGIGAALIELSQSVKAALAAEAEVQESVERPVREAAAARRLDQREQSRNEAMLFIQRAQQHLRQDAAASRGAAAKLDEDGNTVE